jgi:hypothetical protein
VAAWLTRDGAKCVRGRFDANAETKHAPASRPKDWSDATSKAQANAIAADRCRAVGFANACN